MPPIVIRVEHANLRQVARRQHGQHDGLESRAIMLASGVMLASERIWAQGGGTPAENDLGPSGAGSADEDSLPGVDATSSEDMPWSRLGGQ
jgi:hypothetical protein